MGKKAEERERRRAEKLEKFEEARASLLEKIVPDLVPKAASEPEPHDTPKLAPHLERESNKEPKAVEDGSRFDRQVTWCITKADRDGHWSWPERSEPRDWTDDEWESVIYPPFKEFGQMTWATVDSFASGSEHKMHHGQPFNRIVDAGVSSFSVQ